MEKEIYATGLVKPKTTALFFDKIWLPKEYQKFMILERDWDNIRNELLFKGILQIDNKSKKEVIKKLLNKVTTPIIPKSINLDNTKHISNDILIHGMANVCYNIGIINTGHIEGAFFNSSKNRNITIKNTVEIYKMKYNIDIVPIYLDPTNFDTEYNIQTIENKNASPLVILSLEFLDSIVEDSLDWGQVLEIREDKDSIYKIRRLRNWMNIELLGMEKEKIISILDEALYDYKKALNKFGVLTAVGGFTTALSGSSTILTGISKDWNDILAGGLAVASGAFLYTTNEYFKYKSVKNHPIAYIYDIYKKLNIN